MLWRGHIAKEKITGKTKGRQKTNETSWLCGNTSGSFSGSIAGW
jgi:hypothetical protein